MASVAMISKSLKVGFISAWVTRSGGGVSEAVASLARALDATGKIKLSIFSLADEFLEVDRPRYEGLELAAFKQFGPRSFGFSPGLYRSVLRSDIDVLHLHGIWMFPSIVGSAWARQTGRPYVISPHGMLEAWILGRNRCKKKLARFAYENRNLNSANALHALNRDESNSIKSILPTSTIVEIPNGINLDIEAGGLEERSYSSRYVCFLCRLHPKKNVEGLLDAWLQIKDVVRLRNYRLVIAGWGEDEYVKTILQRIEYIAPEAPVEFVGPKYGIEKSHLLSGADYLILPSFSEGLPMTVLEAWGFGTPTLITKFCNLPEGFSSGAAIEIGTSCAGIVPALTQALECNAEIWATRSARAKELVRDEYSLQNIAERWIELYASLVKE